MNLLDVIQYYKDKSAFEQARAQRVWENPLWGQIAGGNMAYDPLQQAMWEFNSNPIVAGLRAPADNLFAFLDKPSVDTGVESALDWIPTDKMAMAGLGMVKAADAKKFASGIFKKLQSGNPFWTEMNREFKDWKDYRYIMENKTPGPFNEEWNKFWSEKHPMRGMEVNFVDNPAEYYGKIPRNPDYVGKDMYDQAYKDLVSTQAFVDRPQWTPSDRMGKQKSVLSKPEDDVIPEWHTRRIQQGVFKEGLQPGDRIWRGDRDPLTADAALIANDELGPHHTVERGVAEGYFSNPNDMPWDGGMGVLMQHEWQGTGRGYPLEQDLNNFSIENVGEKLRQDGLLPKEALDEIDDLVKRWKDVSPYAGWNHSPLNNSLNVATQQELYRIMREHGYDHFTYPNKHEGTGNVSVIPLSPNLWKEVDRTWTADPYFQETYMNAANNAALAHEAGLLSDAEYLDYKNLHRQTLLDNLLGLSGTSYNANSDMSELVDPSRYEVREISKKGMEQLFNAKDNLPDAPTNLIDYVINYFKNQI